jgi:hypothetical protein
LERAIGRRHGRSRSTVATLAQGEDAAILATDAGCTIPPQGLPPVHAESKVGSAEFMAHYSELKAASESPSPSRAQPDTINALNNLLSLENKVLPLFIRRYRPWVRRSCEPQPW